MSPIVLARGCLAGSMSNFLQLVRVRLALSLTLSDKPRNYLEKNLYLVFQAQRVCFLFLRVQLYSDVQEVLFHALLHSDSFGTSAFFQRLRLETAMTLSLFWYPVELTVEL